ncbi:MAG: exodeoxyribonuclease V subunit gamma [Clostridiales bacterium]|jgi:ATP-dependent helicase/nuclease subunit B|nr:exodeoxyribonuclease V subunit gamma [Clostridiales bacterium]
MINIIVSKTTKGVTDGIIDALKNNMAENPFGHHIVVVPDNAALYTELKLMEELRLFGTFNIEVASFMRLAKKYVNLSNVLTDDGALMILKRIISENPDALECFRKSTESEGFLKEMYGLICDIRNSRIDIDKLTALPSNTPPKLKYKLSDAAYLYKNYVREIQESYGDSLSYLEKLCLTVEKNAHLATAHYYIMLYDGFSALEYEIIGKLSACGGADIGIIRNDAAPNAAVFAASGVLEALKTLSGDGGYRIKEYDSGIEGVFAHIADNIFSYSECRKISAENGKINLTEHKTPKEEVMYAAREICALIDGGGADYSDIAVLVSDTAKYAPYIKAVFGRFGIPYSSGAKDKTKDGALAKFLKAAVELHKKNFYIVNVLEFVKNPYSGIDFEAAEEFESYCLKHNIEYISSPLEDQNAERVRLAAVRAAAPFKDAKKNVTAAEFLKLIEEFFEINAIDAKTEEYVNADNSGADVYFRVRCYKKIKSILNETGRVFAGSGMKLSEFFDIFFASVASAETASLQEKLNVYTGKTGDGVFDKKALFILGADAGKFPAARKFSKIITEGEAKALIAAGVVFDDGAEAENAHAAALLYSPSDKLYVCRNISEGLGRSSVYGLIMSLFGDVAVKTPDGGVIGLSGADAANKADDLLYFSPRRGNLFYTVLSGIQNADKEDYRLFSAAHSLLERGEQKIIKRRISEINALNGYAPEKAYIKNGAEELFFRSGSMRVTQAERYYACPYGHFLRYGIRLNETADGSLEAKDTGNIVHEILDGFIVRSKDMTTEAAAVFAERVIDRVLEHSFADKLGSQKNSNIKKRIKEDMTRICADLHAFILNSDFKPFLTEASVAKDGDFAPVPLKDGITLIGKIDRVDLCGDKVCVIDYKTGGISGNIFSDLYYGNKLQLFIYLYALCKDKNYSAAAALYLKIKDNFLKEEDNAMRYRTVGCVADDTAAAALLDNDLKNGAEKSRILPVKIKDGAMLADASSGLLSAEEFQNICRLGVTMAEKAAQEIKSGYIEKKPYAAKEKTACDYCPYKIICGKGAVCREQHTVCKDELLKIINPIV